MTHLKIGYVGMTHLGLNSATAAAEKGFSVICFDPDNHLISRLKQGQLPFIEPLLPELMKKNKEQIHFTHQESDLTECNLVYVAPDIPTNHLGESDLKPIQALIQQIEPFLHSNAILIILSQVPPGFTSQIQRKFSNTFYQVETLIFGQAMERALKPERFIIGAANPKLPLPSRFSQFLQAFECPILPMRYESAELSKIAINMFLVSSVSTTNSLAELCEKIGADWSEITPALQLDKRIGKHAYLAPGLGIAGGNLERDLTSFCNLSDLHGTDSGVVRAWQKNVRYRRDWVIKKIHQTIYLNKDLIISVLGLSYKKDTSSLKNSPTLDVLYHLQNIMVRAYDPVVKSLPKSYSNTEIFPTARDAYKGADLLLIMTPWDEFRRLPLKQVYEDLRGKTIIDPYGVLDQNECCKMGLNYHKLGV